MSVVEPPAASLPLMLLDDGVSNGSSLLASLSTQDRVPLVFVLISTLPPSPPPRLHAIRPGWERQPRQDGRGPGLWARIDYPGRTNPSDHLQSYVKYRFNIIIAYDQISFIILLIIPRYIRAATHDLFHSLGLII